MTKRFIFLVIAIVVITINWSFSTFYFNPVSIYKQEKTKLNLSIRIEKLNDKKLIVYYSIQNNTDSSVVFMNYSTSNFFYFSLLIKDTDDKVILESCKKENKKRLKIYKRKSNYTILQPHSNIEFKYKFKNCSNLDFLKNDEIVLPRGKYTFLMSYSFKDNEDKFFTGGSKTNDLFEKCWNGSLQSKEIKIEIE